MTLDAVVIGSGPNGLAAANALSERGWSVLVLEEQAVAGGGLKTEGLTLPGFRHDVFSAVHPAAAASPVFARWGLGRMGLAWVQPEIAMAHPLEEGGCVSLHRQLDLTRSSLAQAYVGDGNRWASFVDPYLGSYRAVRSVMLAAFPPLAGAAGVVLGLGGRGALEFLRVTTSSALTIAEDVFTGDAGRAWFYGLAMHSDIGPRMPGTAVMALHLALLGHSVGWPSPRYGAGSLAAALAGRLRSLAGEVRVETPVEGLAVEGGRVLGVRAEGRVIPSRTVFCAISASHLLRLASDDLPNGYRESLQRFRPGPAVLKVDWALCEPIPWLAEDARRAGTVHVGGGAEQLLSASDALESGQLPERPFVIVGQQSLADETRAPAGSHTAWGYARLPTDVDEADLAAYATRIEDQIERFAPGFRDRVLARHVLTPRRMEAANANLVGGDIGAGSYSLEQMLLRPMPSLSPYRMPVKGLYLAGASTFPGGSVHGVSGWAAARCALRSRQAIRRWPYRVARR